MKNIYLKWGIFLLIISFIFVVPKNIKAVEIKYINDSSDRLIEIHEDGVKVVSFDYDNNGNLLSQVIHPVDEPIGLKLLTVNENSASLQWSAVPYATKYNVYLDDSLLFTTKNTQATIYDLKGITQYKISVQALNSFSKSDNVEEKTFITSFSSPTGLKAENIKENSFTVSWEAVEGATEYQVFKLHPSGIFPLMVGKTAETSFNFTEGIKHGTGYKVYIKAVNSTSKSSFSESLELFTLMESPYKDTYEENDNQQNAHPIVMDELYTSYISSLTDVDYYKFPSKLGGINKPQIYVYFSSDRNYIVDVYSVGGQKVQTFNSSVNGRFAISNLAFGNGLGDVYLAVRGDYSYSTKDHYPLKITYGDPLGCNRGVCETSLVSPFKSASLMSRFYIEESTIDFDELDTLSLIYSDILDTKKIGYAYLGDSGGPEDLISLNYLKQGAQPEEISYIDWTLAKIAKRIFLDQPQIYVEYLDALSDIENKEIKDWLNNELSTLATNYPDIQPTKENANNNEVPA
ncbi:hypothetical protein B14911_10572 [Bacillus sp. NRRL B-14911]|uniref:fibronectin type III domain-containing protein n=1 Tax=Bacillus sp. NRRL B-14911 TaxID=313627 RepID=UPI00006B598B|nr:fibronectin type III domain-containing protein [Bacillus sp. NRRL B-14911]EAR66172.1 hypothetical protein B14911_10572 [Bacillus sp. NRRL B-14911]